MEPAPRLQDLRIGGQQPECLACAQRSHDAEVPLVERCDVDRAESLGERDERCAGEPESRIGVALCDATADAIAPAHHATRQAPATRSAPSARPARRESGRHRPRMATGLERCEQSRLSVHASRDSPDGALVASGFAATGAQTSARASACTVCCGSALLARRRRDPNALEQRYP